MGEESDEDGTSSESRSDTSAEEADEKDADLEFVGLINQITPEEEDTGIDDTGY